MIALRRLYSFVPETIIGNRIPTELFVILSRCNHDGPLVEHGPTYTDRSKLHVNVLRRYRKLLQDVISSGSLGDELGFLQVLDIIPLARKGHFDVRCFLPTLVFAKDIKPDSYIRSLALRLQQSMNAQSKEIRSRICRNQVEYKRPTFHFVVETDAEPPCCVSLDPGNSNNVDYLKADQINAGFTVVKPNNVYGLPREDLLKKVRSAMKRNDYNCGHEYNPEIEAEQNKPPKPFRIDPRVATEWEKLWKQRQSARSDARRERRLARQNLGLCRLVKDQHDVTILNMGSDER